MKSPLVFAVAKATAATLSHLKLPQPALQPRAVDPNLEQRVREFAQRMSAPRKAHQLGM